MKKLDENLTTHWAFYRAIHLIAGLILSTIISIVGFVLILHHSVNAVNLHTEKLPNTPFYMSVFGSFFLIFFFILFCFEISAILNTNEIAPDFSLETTEKNQSEI